MLKTKRKKLVESRKSGNVVHLLDDLAAMNVSGLFGKRTFKSIILLTLKENVQIFHPFIFLDFSIKIENEKFSLNLYDKIDSSPFTPVFSPRLFSKFVLIYAYETIEMRYIFSPPPPFPPKFI